MSNVKKSNSWTREEVHKENLTQGGSPIMMQIFMSHIKVIKVEIHFLNILRIFDDHDI